MLPETIECSSPLIMEFTCNSGRVAAVDFESNICDSINYDSLTTNTVDYRSTLDIEEA
jgi:hypothetical protein